MARETLSKFRIFSYRPIKLALTQLSNKSLLQMLSKGVGRVVVNVSVIQSYSQNYPSWLSHLFC